jgi:tripartite-type tricarboxylate transporter receptor subunit TctC
MLSAPANTPRPVVDKFHSEIARYIATPEGLRTLMDMGLIPGEPTPPSELARFVEREIEQWGKIVHQAGAAGIE